MANRSQRSRCDLLFSNELKLAQQELKCRCAACAVVGGHHLAPLSDGYLPDGLFDALKSRSCDVDMPV